MKNTGAKTWKILSFGTAAVMLAHLIILQLSMARYSAFAGAAWYQDSNKLILVALYGVPIIAVTALTVIFFVSKNIATQKTFCLVKFGIVLPVDFFVFMYMLLFYHNPTSREFLLLIVSCPVVAAIDTLIMIYELNKIKRQSKFCNE